MKKILVPEGMVEAVQHDCFHALDDYTIRRQLGVALLWWIDEIEKLELCQHDYESVRRMFLVPEQEEIEYDLDPEKARFRVALEKLAKLGNGDAYGNSRGNEIAQEALGMDKRSPVPPQETNIPEEARKFMWFGEIEGVSEDQRVNHNCIIVNAYVAGKKAGSR